MAEAGTDQHPCHAVDDKISSRIFVPASAQNLPIEQSVSSQEDPYEEQAVVADPHRIGDEVVEEHNDSTQKQSEDRKVRLLLHQTHDQHQRGNGPQGHHQVALVDCDGDGIDVPSKIRHGGPLTAPGEAGQSRRERNPLG